MICQISARCRSVTSFEPASVMEFGFKRQDKTLTITDKRSQHNSIIEKLKCRPMPNVTAALLNIGGAVCESSVISFLAPRCKVWLTLTARVPCSDAANIAALKTWTLSEFRTWQNSVRGKSRRKCVYSAPAQETAKHGARFG